MSLYLICHEREICLACFENNPRDWTECLCKCDLSSCFTWAWRVGFHWWDSLAICKNRSPIQGKSVAAAYILLLRSPSPKSLSTHWTMPETGISWGMLYIGTERWPRLTLYFFCLISSVCHFFKEPYFFLVFRKQDLNAEDITAFRMMCLLSRPYPWMVETHRTACVCMHMGVYIPTFINFFNFMFIWFLLHEQLNDCYKHIPASELKSATVFCWEDRTGRQ